MPLAQRDGDRVLMNSEIRECRRPHRAVRRLDLEDVAALDAEPLRGLGMDLDPRAPADLRDRVGQLLEPRLVRAATVAEHRRRIRDEEEVALRRSRSPALSARGDGRRPRRVRARQCASRDALRQRRGEGLRAAGERRDEPAAIVRRGELRRVRRILLGDERAAHRQSDAAGASLRRCSERPDPSPAAARDHAAHRLGVAPRLERVQIRNDEVAQLGGLVRDSSRSSP